MKQMRFRLLLALLAALLFVACSPAGETVVDNHQTTGTEIDGHDAGNSHSHSHADSHGDSHDHDQDHDHGLRIPNNGATVRIVAPTSGESFTRGEQVIVEIETENFVLSEDGNHWHVYVNEENWGMVMGANYSEVLRGLTPGTHEISVYLSIDTHEELADGDVVTITVTD
jgi:ABC-type Zn2+ transport system substrate-binding protein/surface adhesin